MPKFAVAIVGAGLSGLLLAIALQKYAPDVDFEIYEGASELSEIGAGIGMHARTWAVMQAIGLDQSLLKIAGNGERPAVSLVYRKSDQAEGVLLGTAQSNNTAGSYTFHRAQLQTAFLTYLKQAGPYAIHLNKRFVTYSQREGIAGGIELRFQDGTSATCDVLVGADGIRSAVRSAMYTHFAAAALALGKKEEAAELETYIPAVFSGCAICRTVISKDTVSEEVARLPAFNSPSMMLYFGKNRHFVSYPISLGRALNVGAVLRVHEQEGKVYHGPWISTVSKDEVVKQFSSWEPEVQEILKAAQGFNKWAINVVTKLPTYVDGAVGLLGDAAHAMTPFLGAGVGQCFEDVFLLAQFLGSPEVTKETVPAALKVYDEIRRPFSQSIASRSQRSGEVGHLVTPDFAALTEEQSATGTGLTYEQIQGVGEEMERLTRWEVASFMDENEASLRKLGEALSNVAAK